MLASVRLPRAALLASLAMLCALFVVSGASPASAAEKTWSASQTIPVPPASYFAGNGGGDGWSVALSTDEVYNVFHHGLELTVNCHVQADSSECWSAPKTITDASGHNFATSGHSGLYLDQNSGKLYVYATQTTDSIGGVVCIDTTEPASTPNPFCGFTALTPAQGATVASGFGALSAPMQVGDRLYSFNYRPGFAVSGAQNAVLCFDLETDAACAGQPFAVDIGASTVANRSPSPSTAAIGDQLMIPVATNAGLDVLVCFDPATQDDCAGSWPAQVGIDSAGSDGGPFPLMSANGTITGVCLPTGADPCFTLDGASTPTPDGMPSVINNSEPWNGPSVVIGPRVYVPTGSGDLVQCFDYSTGVSCENFPKTFSGLGYLYTVNPDPERSDCLWVNADGGSAQIQNFDAYTGQPCGQGPLRVLASASVIAQPQCTPSSYGSLQVLSPARDTYDSGSVTFVDGTGNPIAGAADRPVDSTGTVDLAGLDLNTATGLPQFLITLTGQTGDSSSITLTLTWTGEESADCTPPVDPPLTEISLPASGTRFVLDEPAPTSFSCTDGEGGPGIETCIDSNNVSGSADTGSGSTGAGALDTSAYGAYTYSVHATSATGQSRTASIMYSVARPQTIDFESASVAYGGADFSPASASSGLPATYSDPSGACSVDSGGAQVHLLGAGSCTVTADQDGNASYLAAPPVTQTFAITKGSQTISFPARSVSMTHADFSPASATSGLAVAYGDASGACTISEQGLVDVTGEGSCTVTAGQAGNDDYDAATPVTQTFTVHSGPHVELVGAACVSFGRSGYIQVFTASVVGVDDRYYEIFAQLSSGAYRWDDPYGYGSGYGDGDVEVSAYAQANSAPTTVWLAVWDGYGETLIVETEVPVCPPSTDPTTVSVVGGCVPVTDGQVQPYYADLTNVDDSVYVFTEASPSLPEDLDSMYLYGSGEVGAAGTVHVANQYHNSGVESSTVWVTVRPTSGFFGTIYAQAEVPVCGTDSTPPEVTSQVSSGPSASGWYAIGFDDPALSWLLTDAESAISDQPGCGPQTVDYDTTGVTFTCSATSLGGTTIVTSTTIKRDKTPPNLSVPDAPVVVEATGPDGATATYSTLSSDATSGPGPVLCSRDSGSMFDLGSTTVTCNTADLAGNATDASFTVRVVDTTPPVVSVSEDRVTEATSADGANVFFDAPTATDLVDESVDATCDHGSGDTFAQGTTTVTCSATDAADNEDSESFTVTVNPNTPPTSDAGDDVTGDEGSAVALDGTVADDKDAASAHWTIDDAACTFADASATDITVTCTDDGVYTATLTADDGVNSPVRDTAKVTIANVAPTATLSSANPLTPYATMTERTFSYSIGDPGDDTVSAVATSCGSAGSKVSGSDTNTNTGGSFRCVFDAAPASSTVSVSATDSDDDTGDADTQEVTVTAHAPVANDDTATVEEDAAATNVDVLANDTDVETEAIQITAVSDPEDGTATVVDGTPDRIAYTPDTNHCGADSFTYTVNGGDTATVEVTVTCVDDDPAAAGDAVTVDEGSAATAVMVLANDTDGDGGMKQVASVTQPANGTVVIADDGHSVTYKPRADYCNSQTGGARDTFTYTLNGGDSATVTITVTCPAAPAATPVPTASPTPVPVPVPVPVKPPVPLPLTCSGRSIVLVDVHRAGARVVVGGVAKTSLAGQTVVIRDVTTRHQLASATIKGDGTFAASVALPSSSKIATIRYQALIGRKRSAALRLARQLSILSTTATATGVRITGRLSGVTSARTITISRQVSCEKFTAISTISTSRTGRFSVRIPAPAATVGVAFFRASSVLRNGETFSLPIALRGQAR